MRLAGIDLAWKPGRNPSAIALGELSGQGLYLDGVQSAVQGLDAIIDGLDVAGPLAGIAIDASLIINNLTGQRECERQLARDYAARRAACHPTNLTLYPEAASVALSLRLARSGCMHLGSPTSSAFQIECYPHPAIIEIFGLPERLRYKKGTVAQRKAGQVVLANFLVALSESPVLPLRCEGGARRLLDQDYIQSLAGTRLKQNEDALDAIVCLYIAGLYTRNVPHTVYGDTRSGYIYVPQVMCLQA